MEVMNSVDLWEGGDMLLLHEESVLQEAELLSELALGFLALTWPSGGSGTGKKTPELALAIEEVRQARAWGCPS